MPMTSPTSSELLAMKHHQGSSKPPVPKFSSFKPKPPPESPKTSESSPARPEARHNRPRAEQTPGDEGRDRVHRSRHSSKQHDNQERWHDHTEPRKQYRDNQRRAEERHHKRRYRSRSRSRSRSRNRSERHHASVRGYESKPLREIKPQSGDREKDYFVVDRKGDQDNLVYGRLNRWSIPAYTRAGAGYVLGLSSDFRIDRFESDDKGIAIASKGHHGKAERRLLSRQYRTQDVPTLRVVKPMSDLQDEFESTQDFIPVRSRKRKRGSEEPDMEGELIDYRSIEGKAKAKNALDDSDLEDANDLDGDAYQDFLTETKERNAMLTRKVQEEPHSLSAWLDLIEHQEAMIRIGSSDVHRQLNATERHALASLRLDIYERALKLINEERLVLGLMNESSKIHGREEHFKKWRQFLQEHPESTSLWIKYIDTLQTNLAEFRYENCHAKYLDCLRLLSSQGSRTNQNLRVYLLLRLTSMMRDAGYQERAVALWQALFEYQLCRPEETSLQDFEEFWESECPRMGEPGSQGWAIHRQKGQWPDPPDSGTAVHDVVTDSKDLFRSFVTNERRLAEVFEFPGRTIDEAGEEDPFHVVLFNDIQSELELLQDKIPPVMLVEAYLCFWGLPPLVTSELETRKWWLDPFLRHEKLDCCEYETLPSHTETDHSTTFDNSWNPKMTYTQISTCDLFDSNAFGKVCHRGQQEWLRRTFKTLANAVDLDAVAEYYLAFEWHCNPTGAAKAAKAILKKRSSSLRLYNAYALIESRSGNKAEANRVFSTALGLSTQLGHDAQKMAILLWRTWIWEALREDDVAAVRHRVSSIGDAKPTPELLASTEESQDFSPSTLLKVRRALTEGRDHSLSTNEPMLAVQYTECLAVLEYLHSQLDIAAALDPFHYLSKQLESRKLLFAAAHEAAHQAKHQLLTHHAQRTKLFKPSILREELQKSVALFPDNTRFLSLYASHEARFRIDDRLRAILQDVVLSEKRAGGGGGGGGGNSGPSIIAWHFSIHSEIARSRAAVAVGAGSSSGTSHAVRAAFEKALADDAVGSKSAALWSSYVVYLARQLGDAQAAKAAFFRGLLRLPFAKHYVLLAFEVLGEEVLGFRDARSVYNTLHEKELRVRVDIDAELDRLERAAEERRARDLLVQQDDFERS